MLSIILIFCLGIIVYSNTFHCSFHFDDPASIVDNLAIRNISNLQAIWNFWPCRFIDYLSIAFNYHFNGLDVFGYHIFNVGVHLITAVLVWWLTLLTFSTPAMREEKIARHAKTIALLAGLLFVSHPLQTQAITYIVQRAAAMAALLYVASLSFYVKSRLFQIKNETPGLGRFYYICSLLTAIMAMFTKETAITLPLMIIFYEFSFLKVKNNFNWKQLMPFLMAIFIIPLTMVFTKSVDFQEMHRVTEGASGISSMHYFLTQLRVIVTYIRLTFLPLNQNLDYDYPVFKSIFELPVLLSFLFLSAILFSAQRLFLKYRLVSFSIFWFFLTLLPESSFIPITDVIFEHRLYLPMAGYCMFLVSGAYYLLGKNNIKMMVVVLLLIIACNSVLTYQRNKVWKDDGTLWTDTIYKSPHKARPFFNRGGFYDRQQFLTKALADYNKAIILDPDIPLYYSSRGSIYFKQGEFTLALADYSKAIELDPNNPEYYFDRGVIYGKQGKSNQALMEYTKAIIINHSYFPSYINRGEIYAQYGKFDLALIEYSRAIEIYPNFFPAYHNRYQLYYQLKEYDKAWADVHKVEELGYAVDPGFISGLKKSSGRDY